ncbi:SIMPL domain-containing protein [Lebetimonas sp. JH369]|uniref:SIMPL domain-containing protein n=1 Tax=Lebetimonas sp. JH369 TaxID=990069 RepID=UPI00046559B6|nr:SIMPL domain-containing protein [Lebetimonas sp. JH369]
MKKIFFLFLMLNFLFSYEITNIKIFKTKYKPNIYKTKLNIKIKEKNVEKLIKQIDFNIKKANNICQKINYTIYPDYIYNKNNKKFVGYIGNMSLDCQFKTDNVKNFSEIFTNLIGEKTLSAISLDLNKNDKTKLINNLRSKAYSFALEVAKNFSKKLKLKCYPTDIKINSNPVNVKPMFKPMYKSINTLPSPKEQTEESISIFYKINCF